MFISQALDTLNPFEVPAAAGPLRGSAGEGRSGNKGRHHARDVDCGLERPVAEAQELHRAASDARGELGFRVLGLGFGVWGLGFRV